MSLPKRMTSEMITQVPHYLKNGKPLGHGLYATNTPLLWVISSAA